MVFGHAAIQNALLSVARRSALRNSTLCATLHSKAPHSFGTQDHELGNKRHIPMRRSGSTKQASHPFGRQDLRTTKQATYTHAPLRIYEASVTPIRQTRSKNYEASDIHPCVAHDLRSKRHTHSAHKSYELRSKRHIPMRRSQSSEQAPHPCGTQDLRTMKQASYAHACDRTKPTRLDHAIGQNQRVWIPLMTYEASVTPRRHEDLRSKRHPHARLEDLGSKRHTSASLSRCQAHKLPKVVILFCARAWSFLHSFINSSIVFFSAFVSTASVALSARTAACALSLYCSS